MFGVAMLVPSASARRLFKMPRCPPCLLGSAGRKAARPVPAAQPSAGAAWRGMRSRARPALRCGRAGVRGGLAGGHGGDGVVGWGGGNGGGGVSRLAGGALVKSPALTGQTHCTPGGGGWDGGWHGVRIRLQPARKPHQVGARQTNACLVAALQCDAGCGLGNGGSCLPSGQCRTCDRYYGMVNGQCQEVSSRCRLQQGGVGVRVWWCWWWWLVCVCGGGGVKGGQVLCFLQLLCQPSPSPSLA